MLRSNALRTALLWAATISALALVSTASVAQRYAPQEVDRSNSTCSQIAQNCMRQQGQLVCDGLKQECIRTGTWQGAREISRNVQRR